MGIAPVGIRLPTVKSSMPTDTMRHKRVAQEAEAEARRREAERVSHMRTVLETKSGRAFVARLLDELGTTSQTFHANAMTMAMQSGLRDFGMRLRTEIERRFPELHMQMLKEHYAAD